MRDIDFSKFVRKNIRSLQPYQAKEIPCRAKLDANESPYTIDNAGEVLSPELLGTLNRYPDPEAKKLKQAIARDFRIGTGNILLGNGSDEVIYYLIVTFGGPVLYPVPTFSMYGIIAQALGEKHRGVPLDRDFDLDVATMLQVIKRVNPKLLFLSSPNNPTGNCFSSDRIIEVLEASQGIVIVDEAYLPFSKRESLIPLLPDYKNLGVLRTVSKIGFASLRLGFLIAGEGLIGEVNKVRLPYNVNSLSQAVAAEAFMNKKVIQRQIRAVISERVRVFEALSTFKGVTPYPSDANFILFKVTDADAVFKSLVESGVLLRNMSGLIEDTLRVTIGTPVENTLFLKALRKTLGR